MKDGGLASYVVSATSTLTLLHLLLVIDLVTSFADSQVRVQEVELTRNETASSTLHAHAVLLVTVSGRGSLVVMLVTV